VVVTGTEFFYVFVASASVLLLALAAAIGCLLLDTLRRYFR
jgi:hypothetical protein